jgi:hypothetical protein
MRRSRRRRARTWPLQLIVPSVPSSSPSSLSGGCAVHPRIAAFATCGNGDGHGREGHRSRSAPGSVHKAPYPSRNPGPREKGTRPSGSFAPGTPPRFCPWKTRSALGPLRRSKPVRGVAVLPSAPPTAQIALPQVILRGAPGLDRGRWQGVRFAATGGGRTNSHRGAVFRKSWIGAVALSALAALAAATIPLRPRVR